MLSGACPTLIHWSRVRIIVHPLLQWHFYSF